MKKIGMLCIIAAALMLTSCGKGYSGEIPDLIFWPAKYTDDAKPCFYLFDDNPEHLNPEFLADGEEPSAIASFDGLTPGVYTVFSYHHRGSAAQSEQDLFFDMLFGTQSGAELKINRIGLDHDWQWNKAWADFSGVDVFSPMYLRTYSCENGGDCGDADCSCRVENELTLSDSTQFSELGEKVILGAGDKKLLSEVIPDIAEERINEIRHGGYNEPVWLMMEFEIVSGELSADTIAYCDREKARENFDTMKNGRVAYEPQFKGIAQNAPEVVANLSYTITDDIKAGPLPVRIFNQRHPDGYVCRDGWFATNVNTWKDEKLISAESAESDMMHLSYKDAEKFNLYGENVIEKDDIWHFDPFYTSLYSDEDNENFVPNIPMSQVDYPKGRENTTKDFYSKYVLNLGNFGVRYIYSISLKNEGEKDRTFMFSMNSPSGQLYRFSMKRDGETVRDDGGMYIMKLCDVDPREDPDSKTEPKERLKPDKYTTTEEFVLESGGEYELVFEVVTLTGCDAPMTNMMSIK